MSVDRSLRITGALKRHRNVLSRGERIETLKDEERWNQGDAVIGLPKVAHRKAAAGKKTVEKTDEAAAAAGTDQTPAAAAPTPGKK